MVERKKRVDRKIDTNEVTMMAMVLDRFSCDHSIFHFPSSHSHDNV